MYTVFSLHQGTTPGCTVHANCYWRWALLLWLFGTTQAMTAIDKCYFSFGGKPYRLDPCKADRTNKCGITDYDPQLFTAFVDMETRDTTYLRYAWLTPQWNAPDCPDGTFRPINFTREYILWPRDTSASRCTAILETNALLPAGCPLPDSCAPTVSTIISATWYGEEVTLCMGAGTGTQAVSDNGVPLDSLGMPDERWAAVHRLEAVPLRCDACGSLKHYRAIYHKGQWSVVAWDSLYNTIVFDTELMTVHIANPNLIRTTDGKRCPGNAVVEGTFPMGDWVAPTLAILGTFWNERPIRGWPQTLHRTLTPDYLRLDANRTVVNHEPRPCSDSKCRVIMVGLATDDGTRGVQHKCLNHRYLRKYSLPGSNLIVDAFRHVIDWLADFGVWLLEHAFEWLIEAYNIIDMRVRLTELVMCFAMVYWHLEDCIKSIYIVGLYTLMTGLIR
ncbi:putative capsid protein [Linepithema humile C virus 1]|uniref:Capsid protein n=1 Tax=Linepithema humile C virus 1 TaxID=2259784 RepID=A0AC61U901_9VIRU|nr:putative capsid protein [Linepithema humile C-virus 1]